MPDNMPAPERVDLPSGWSIQRNYHPAIYGKGNFSITPPGGERSWIVSQSEATALSIALADREAADRVEAGPTWEEYERLANQYSISSHALGLSEVDGLVSACRVMRENRTTLDAFVRRLLALAEAGRAVPEGWQPIESAPRDGTEVLTYGPDSDGSAEIAVGHWPAGHGQMWICGAAWERLYPTHWRPLPDPPTAPHDQERTP